MPMQAATRVFSPGADFMDNPYPLYREMLGSGVPYWMPKADATGLPGTWLISRYDDALEIVKMSGPITKCPAKVCPQHAPTLLDATILQLDPPDHTRLRGLVSDVFSLKNLRQFQPTIRQVAENLLSELTDTEGGDFIAGFATPLPIAVISTILGIPPEDREMLLELVNRIVVGTDSTYKDKIVAGAMMQALTGLLEYFGRLIAKRRSHPGSDLLSGLVVAHDRDASLDATELLKMCALLLITGYESTVGLLGNGLYTLLRFPEEFELLRRQPALLASAIEEMLRYESPLQRSTFRALTADMEIGGKMLHAGEEVTVVIGAANRDQDVFHDPDRFDIRRTPNRHLAFGSGIHACLGATLARLEAEIAFSALLTRVSGIELAGEVRWKPNSVLRTLERLPLSLTR